MGTDALWFQAAALAVVVWESSGLCAILGNLRAWV